MMSNNKLLSASAILGQLGVAKDMKVADLGCGQYGYFVFSLARMVGAAGRVYGVDIIKGALELIKKQAKLENLPQIETVWSDLEVYGATPIPSGSLDAAFLINTLYQSHHSLDMLKEAMRMLKPQGKLVIVDWGEKDKNIGPPPFQRVKKEKLLAVLAGLGLVLEQEFSPGAYHYGLNYKKK